MKHQQVKLSLPVDHSLPELLASFQNYCSVDVLPETAVYRVFYDTFDWLLYHHGAVLETCEDERSRRIYWRANPQTALRIQLGLNDVPQLASDLPDSAFRRELQSVISVRELIPRIKIEIKRLPLVVPDSNDKAAVHVYFDEHRYVPTTDGAATILGKRITIKPVKGCAHEFSRVEAFFQTMQLHQAEDNILRLALAESGHDTAAYSNKLNLVLDPGMPAERAMKQILLRLLEIMQQNMAGTIRGKDTEFMHDYRVSIRKTRSALTQITHVLPQEVIARYNKFFSELGKLTNPIRDIDVFLLKLEGYAAWLKEPLHDSIVPLNDYLVRTRAKAQAKFIATVQSAEHSNTIAEWRAYLENPAPTEPRLENTEKPVSALANELIWNMYQLALEEGNAITDESAAEELHELRKTCKKLRYLMEFFQSLYPAKDIRGLIQAMKGLQDNLGEFNDLHVHAGILKKFIKHSNDPRAKKACRKLIDKLKQKQARTRNRFSARYTAFASNENQHEFSLLFAGSHTE